jgi:hypothetical protein
MATNRIIAVSRSSGNLARKLNRREVKKEIAFLPGGKAFAVEPLSINGELQ